MIAQQTVLRRKRTQDVEPARQSDHELAILVSVGGKRRVHVAICKTGGLCSGPVCGRCGHGLLDAVYKTIGAA